MKALVAALSESKRPALVVGPGVDRAQAVELMVQCCREGEGRGLGQPVFRALLVSRNVIRNSRASCTPRPGSSRRRCAITTSWS